MQCTKVGVPVQGMRHNGSIGHDTSKQLPSTLQTLRVKDVWLVVVDDCVDEAVEKETLVELPVIVETSVVL